MNKGIAGEVYNIGGNNERPNIHILKTIIAEISEATSDSAIDETLISYVEDRKGHDRRYGIAPDKIKRDLGWYPETPFEEGIVKTIQWYLDNPAWVLHVTSGAYQEYYATMYERR